MKKPKERYFNTKRDIGIQLDLYWQESLLQFVSVASGGMSAELKKNGSPTRNKLEKLVQDVIEADPEFILKVVLRKYPFLTYSILDCFVLSQRSQSETHLQSSSCFCCPRQGHILLFEEIFFRQHQLAIRLDHGGQSLHDP